MILVAHNLWVGADADYRGLDDEQRQAWAVVHCCKEPHHREALGYTGRGAPKDHPEYLFCFRDNRLILNMVDADDPAYVPKPMVDAAVSFTRQCLVMDKPVLIHCNQGRSRSPSIAMLVMAPDLPADFDKAELAMVAMYADYEPKNGVRSFAREHWAEYRGQA
jgi:hypothetical protein